jgi:hypothetical protein
MNSIIKPLHIATIGGHPLRFFCTPNSDGRPDLPWHAVDDLHRCLGLNRDARRFFLHKLREWGGVKTVATADGVLTIAPHFMAQGVIDAMIDNGQAPASIRREYDHAGTEATRKFNIPHDELLLWLRDAMNRWERPERAP